VKKFLTLVNLLILVIGVVKPAYAYIGPALTVGAFTSAIAFIALSLFTIIFLIYIIFKRIFKKKK